MASDSWDPQLYERFRRERIQPARDLIAMVRPQPEMRVIDLGCGTGEVTRELHEHVRASRTLGIDRSPTMLAQAKPRETTGLRFIEADIASYAPDQPVDLVYSNAALGWVNDHPRLFARFRSWLAPGGQLAIQVPCADWHPTHTVAARLAEQYGTGQLYQGRRRVLEPAAYAELLFSLGFVEQDVLMRVYGHVLDSVDELVAFFSGTLLNPYRATLGEKRFADFLSDYRAGLIHEMGDSKPVFFPMTRILIWGRA
jgi:trans-aconitate 2-methyltransferase